MVNIDPLLHCITCSNCHATQELRGRNPEQHTIQVTSYAAKHRCRPQTSTPGPADVPAPLDRWKQLFASVTT